MRLDSRLRCRIGRGDGERNQTKTDSLQEENQTFSEFVRRTDELSVRTNLNLSELPQVLGVSKAMLFAYRKGANRITRKVWLRLEAAESAAGLNRLEELVAPAPLSDREVTMEERLARMEGALDRIATALEKLAMRE